jgi:hypothetical protein
VVCRVYLPGVKAFGASRAAAKNDYLHVLEWLASESSIDGTFLVLAYQVRQATVVEWFCKRRASVPWVQDRWEEYEVHRELMPELSLSFLQWIVEQGWACDRFAIEMAAKHSRMDITTVISIKCTT